MKLKDLIQAINEMAMTNYGRYGDFENNSLFSAFPNKKDKELIQSEKHPIRTGNVFKNTKQNIGCYFVAHSMFAGGRISYGDLDKQIKMYSNKKPEIIQQYKLLLSDIKSNKREISFIFSGNRDVNGFVGSTKAIPLTGWVLAHKIAHMLSEHADMEDYYNLSTSILTTISDWLPMYKFSYETTISIYNKLVDASSGRNNKIPNEDEFIAELVATWIWYGHAKVSDISGFVGGDNKISEHDAKMLKEDLQYTINKGMDKIFNQMVGKIYVVPQ
jgi:hypothetical protein